jgi:hypothetical protein
LEIARRADAKCEFLGVILPVSGVCNLGDGWRMIARIAAGVDGVDECRIGKGKGGCIGMDGTSKMLGRCGWEMRRRVVIPVVLGCLDRTG